MSDPLPADTADPGQVPQLPLTFAGFHERHHQAYLEYANAQLHQGHQVEEVVEAVFVELARRWHQVLAKPSPTAFGWALLRHAVEDERHRRGEHLVLIEKAAFAYAIRRDAQDFFSDLESGIGLFQAIADLPQRQFDVVLLRFVLDKDVAYTADVMGIDPAGVRSLTSQARTRLKSRLAPRRLLHRPSEKEQP